MKAKKYWFRDWRDMEEYVTNAYSIQHLSEKTKIPKDKIEILRVYNRKNLDAESLILSY